MRTFYADYHGVQKQLICSYLFLTKYIYLMNITFTSDVLVLKLFYGTTLWVEHGRG